MKVARMLSEPTIIQRHYTDRDADSVAHSVTRLFRQSPYRRLGQLMCEHHEGVVIIRGRLPSFYLKQIAQTLASKVDGVEEIINRTDVKEYPGNASDTDV